MKKNTLSCRRLLIDTTKGGVCWDCPIIIEKKISINYLKTAMTRNQ